MKAVIKPSYDHKRKKLADIIPLDTPFTILIEPTRYCNFKCFYCLHSTRGHKDGELEKTGYNIRHMDNELYERILLDMKKFPVKTKRIVFAGLGEPLMNPWLPHMIKRAKETGAAERLDILTNASLLTPQISDALIEAGTTRIQISLQGLNSQKYKEISNVNVDFDEMYSNIKYLYQNKKNCTIFIKIIDALLEDEKEKEKFFEMFGNLCDQIFIEHLITLQHQMGDHNGKADNSRNLNNEEVIYREVCPVIFYMLQIDVDGNVFPCPVGGLPRHFNIGNLNEKSLVDIWLGVKRSSFIKSQLRLNRKKIPVCGECEACAAVIDRAEFLDDVASELIKRF